MNEWSDSCKIAFECNDKLSELLVLTDMMFIITQKMKSVKTVKTTKKSKKGASWKYTLDLTHPVEDGILDSANFVSFYMFQCWIL